MKEENYYCTSLTDAIDYLLNQKSVGIEKKGVLRIESKIKVVNINESLNHIHNQEALFTQEYFNLPYKSLPVILEKEKKIDIRVLIPSAKLFENLEYDNGTQNSWFFRYDTRNIGEVGKSFIYIGSCTPNREICSLIFNKLPNPIEKSFSWTPRK